MIERVMAEGALNSCSAARVMLPASATARKIRRLCSWSIASKPAIGVWTFFALIGIWADASSATFGRRVEFFVSLFGLR